MCNPTVYLERNKAPRQFAMTFFAGSSDHASLLHFDGPTTWGLVQNLTRTRFVAGKTLERLKVSLGTPGIGRQARALV